MGMEKTTDLLQVDDDDECLKNMAACLLKVSCIFQAQ
jgi:hypothetical protein